MTRVLATPVSDVRVRRTVAVTCVAATLFAGCSHAHHSNSTYSTPASSTESASASRRTHLLTVGTIDVQSAGRATHINSPTQRAVIATAQRYVNSATLAPLETGHLGRDYPQVFAASIRPAATGADRSALTDLAVGKATTFTETSTPVALSALADQSGSLLYVATSFKVNVNATTPSGARTVSRTVELTLELDGSQWLVVAYRTTVRRTAPVAKPPTSTTRRARPREMTTTTPKHRTTNAP